MGGVMAGALSSIQSGPRHRPRCHLQSGSDLSLRARRMATVQERWTTALTRMSLIVALSDALRAYRVSMMLLELRVDRQGWSPPQPLHVHSLFRDVFGLLTAPRGGWLHC